MIISLICVFVAALLIYAVWRFHASRNPVPTTTTHNTFIEIAWTVLPILILVFIAIPSFRLLYYGDKATDAAFTVKVTGHQWFWSYDYPDQGNFSVESRILSEADRVKQKPEVPRLLAVDEEMVIPKDTTIRIIGTAADSMHGWTVWGFGIKKTVIPGRLNEGWINVHDEGLLLRPVLADLRQEPQLHADRGARGLQARIRQVGRAEEEVGGPAARDRRRFRRPSRQPLSASPQER